MSKKVKTLRGTTIDWDLLKIKKEIAAGPTPLEVQERKDYIDNKLRRKIQRAKANIKQQEENKEIFKKESDSVETPKVVESEALKAVEETVSIEKPKRQRRIKKNDKKKKR